MQPPAPQLACLHSPEAPRRQGTGPQPCALWAASSAVPRRDGPGPPLAGSLLLTLPPGALSRVHRHLLWWVLGSLGSARWAGQPALPSLAPDLLGLRGARAAPGTSGQHLEALRVLPSPRQSFGQGCLCQACRKDQSQKTVSGHATTGHLLTWDCEPVTPAPLSGFVSSSVRKSLSPAADCSLRRVLTRRVELLLLLSLERPTLAVRVAGLAWEGCYLEHLPRPAALAASCSALCWLWW